MEKRDIAQKLSIAQPPKGVVDPRGAADRIRLNRYAPCPALAMFVEHYWIVEWDLRGRPAQNQRVLPYPNQHLVISRNDTALYGATRGVFDRRIEGEGCAFGIRFLAGGLRPYLDHDVTAFTDSRVSPAPVLGAAGDALERAIDGARGDHKSMIALVEETLISGRPAADATVAWLGKVIAIAQEEGPTTVEALAGRAGCSTRRLQRIFHNYVGVTPKWTIKRFRIHEAAWQLANSADVNLAHLADALGYFDQAHMARDFASFIGCSPSQYRDSQKSAP